MTKRQRRTRLMTQHKKLTEPQERCLRLMATDWALSCAHGLGYKLQQGGSGRGGKTKTVHANTAQALFDAGMIRQKPGDRFSKEQVLTDLGLAYVEEVLGLDVERVVADQREMDEAARMASIPKWARDRIRLAEGNLASAQADLDAFFSEDRESTNVFLWELVDGRTAPRPLPGNSTVVVCSNDRQHWLKIRPGEGCVRIRAHDDDEQHAGRLDAKEYLSVLPESTNVILVQTIGRERPR